MFRKPVSKKPGVQSTDVKKPDLRMRRRQADCYATYDTNGVRCSWLSFGIPRLSSHDDAAAWFVSPDALKTQELGQASERGKSLSQRSALKSK
jgi:hypothetical protein